MMRPSEHTPLLHALIRLARWHRYTLYGVVVLLTLSGALWLWLHYFGATVGEYGRVPHPQEQTALQIHGAAAMLALFFLGTLLLAHMIRAWEAGRNRWSGGTLAAAMLILTLTGYALYYAGDERLRAGASVLHWVLGLAVPIALVVHITLGRRRP